VNLFLRRMTFSSPLTCASPVKPGMTLNRDAAHGVMFDPLR